MRSKILAHNPLQAIARHGSRDAIAGNGKSQARALQTIYSGKDNELRVTGALAGGKYCFEIRRGPESAGGRKPARRTGHGRTQGVSRFLPFARRDFSTFLPPLVLMRARKP